MYKSIYLIALLLFSLGSESCTSQATSNIVFEENNPSETTNNSPIEHNQEELRKVEINELPEIEYRDISNSLGLIKIAEKGFRKGETVRFYNDF